MLDHRALRNRPLLFACIVALSGAAAATVMTSGCAQGITEFGQGGDTATSSGNGGATTSGSSSSSEGGATTSSSSSWPCGVDCSTISTPDCSVAQCNMQTLQCEVIEAEDGTSCEDGLFCTINDTCLTGICTAGDANDCGMSPPQCSSIICTEASQSCAAQAAQNGASCQDPNNLCLKGTTCSNGLCTGGTLEDCFFFPAPDECHVGVCNPANGICEPQIGNEGGGCTDLNDLCTVAKTCTNGICTGGSPKDCSNLTQGCNLGVCDVMTGQCGTQAVNDGQPCDDLNSCTTGEICSNKQCINGAPVTQCVDNDFCCPANCNDMNDLDCASCDWNPAFFPISFSSSNSVGDMTFDANCNMYFSGDGGDLYKVPYNTAAITKLYDFNSNARGVVFNPNNNLLYVGVVDKIYTITTAGGSPQVLPGASVGSYVNGLAFAPAGWGSYGGHIIVSRSTGAVVAVDPGSGTPVTIGTTSGNVSDVEFDGQNLYVAAYTQKKVLLLSPAGTFTTLGTAPCSVDGLAVEEGKRVFAACGSNNQIYALAIPGGAATLVVPTSALNGGWAPAGLIWDGLNNLIVMEDGFKLSIYSP